MTIKQSGRTFRKVLQALVDASYGRHIVYISNTPQHLEHAKMTAERAAINNSHVQMSKNKICFRDAGAGCVDFITAEQHLQRENGGHYESVPVPNFVFDLN